MRALILLLIGCASVASAEPLNSEQFQELKRLGAVDRHQAVSKAEQYLNQSLPLEQRFAVASLQCTALLDLSQYLAVEKLYQSVSTVFTSESYHGAQIELGACYADALDRQGKTEEAQALFNKIETEFDTDQYPKATATMLVNKSFSFNSRGEYREAVEALNRAASLYDSNELDDIKLLSSIYNATGNAYNYLDMWDLASEFYLKALKWMEQLEDHLGQSVVLYNLADMEGYQGHTESMRGYAERSLVLAEQAGDEVGVAYANYQIAESYGQEKNYQKALQLSAPLLKDFERFQDNEGRLVLRMTRLDWMLKLGIFEQALPEALSLKQQYKQLKSLDGQLHASQDLAIIYRALDNKAALIDELQQQLALTQQIHKNETEQEIEQFHHDLKQTLTDKENQLLQAESQLAQAELNAAKKLRTVLTGLLSILGLFVVLLGMALRRSRKLSTQLENSANSDSLTGLANRRHAMERLHQEHARLKRHKVPFCIALIDIDFFKQINDDYGHQRGDEVLIRIAESFNDCLRQEDLSCRYGGEEFLIILPHTELAQCQTLLQRLRVEIEQLAPQLQLEQLTISAGIAQVHAKETGSEVLQRTDRALYAAKAQGRNRVVTADRAKLA